MAEVAGKMKLRVIEISAVLVAIVIIVAAAAVAVGAKSTNAKKVPPEVKMFAKDWPLPNKDYSNTRATTDSIINSQNVMTLGVAWSYSIQANGGFGGASSNPLIIGDTVLFQDANANTFALDLQTGAVKWSKIYNNTSVLGPNGPGVGYGRVFVTKDPYTIAALNLKTGKEMWSNKLSNVNTTGIDIQPLVYDGKVYTSTVPGQGDVFYSPGGMGVLYALNAATGKKVWSFNTVKDGYLWGHPDVNSGGGSWYPPSVEIKTGSMFWSIANPAPFAGAPGWPSGSSFDAALYTDTMVSINHNNGKLRWYTQALSHDIWDHDLQISPILTDANISGEHQNIILGAGKMGIVYAFNRDDGSLLWSLPVGKHVNDTLDPITGPTQVYPGVLGGVETPMAYSDGMLYVPVINLETTYIPTGISGVDFAHATGELVAINVDYGHIAWKKDFRSFNVGGATVVNDVVFTATFDGTIYAFNKYTGEQLYTCKAPAGINAWPAVAGDTIIWPCGVGPQRYLIALRLDTGPTVTITSPTDGSSVTGPDVTVSVDVSRFNLVDKLGQASVPGEGHLHYFLDVAPPTTPGEIAVTAAGTYAATTATSYTWKGLSVGEHMLSAELVNNDHTPLVPAVVATTFINVIGSSAPALNIVTPADGAMIAGSNVTISVRVINFNLVDKLGQANAPGEGHLHYFMDVMPPTTPGIPAITASGTYAATTATSYQWTGLSPGAHMFSVELVNNDHTPLVPPVVAFVNVTTMPATGAVTVYLSAQNIAFNLSTISVAAGSEVTVIFENLDSGIPHNFAVYTDSSASAIIFQGALITGIATTTYTFSAPVTPGSYFFRCDVHPTQMTGTFIVT